MLRVLKSKLRYSNVIATIALFVALGGTSYAALTITGKNVRDGSLTGKDVKDRSLAAADFGGSLPAGPAGAPGAPGAAGGPGSPGAAGSSGPSGPSGAKGDRGDKGETGSQGGKGDKGDACLPTTPACVGPKGDKGDKGDACLSSDPNCRGAKGDKGDACLSSDPLCKGPKGDKGDAGLNGTGVVVSRRARQTGSAQTSQVATRLTKPTSKLTLTNASWLQAADETNRFIGSTVTMTVPQTCTSVDTDGWPSMLVVQAYVGSTKVGGGGVFYSELTPGGTTDVPLTIDSTLFEPGTETARELELFAGDTCEGDNRSTVTGAAVNVLSFR